MMILTTKKRRDSMPKDYILKNEITSPAKIQRLLKTIDSNAREDREQAQELLKTVKDALAELQNPLEVNEQTGITSPDAFTKLITTAISAINQAGIANERLLKLAALLQKYNTGNEKGGKGVALNGSLFKTIEELANKGQEDD